MSIFKMALITSTALLMVSCSDLGAPTAPGANLVAGSWMLQRMEGGPDQPVYFSSSGLIRVDTYTYQL